PSRDFTLAHFFVRETALEALASKDGEFHLDHIEPPAMLRGVVKLPTLQNPMGVGWRKGFVQGCWRMRVEIVDHDSNDLSFGVIPSDQRLHTGCEVRFGTAGGHFDLPPAVTRLKEHDQVTGAIALILVVVPLRPAWWGGLRMAHFAHQLLGTLIKTPHGIASVIGLAVGIPHVFHPPD